MIPPTDPKRMRFSDLARLLGVNTTTIYRWREDGMECEQTGRSRMWASIDDAGRFLARRLHRVRNHWLKGEVRDRLRRLASVYAKHDPAIRAEREGEYRLIPASVPNLVCQLNPHTEAA